MKTAITLFVALSCIVTSELNAQESSTSFTDLGFKSNQLSWLPSAKTIGHKSLNLSLISGVVMHSYKYTEPFESEERKLTTIAFQAKYGITKRLDVGVFVSNLGEESTFGGPQLKGDTSFYLQVQYQIAYQKGLKPNVLTQLTISPNDVMANIQANYVTEERMMVRGDLSYFAFWESSTRFNQKLVLQLTAQYLITKKTGLNAGLGSNLVDTQININSEYGGMRGNLTGVNYNASVFTQIGKSWLLSLKYARNKFDFIRPTGMIENNYYVNQFHIGVEWFLSK